MSIRPQLGLGCDDWSALIGPHTNSYHVLGLRLYCRFMTNLNYRSFVLLKCRWLFFSVSYPTITSRSENKSSSSVTMPAPTPKGCYVTGCEHTTTSGIPTCNWLIKDLMIHIGGANAEPPQEHEVTAQSGPKPDRLPRPTTESDLGTAVYNTGVNSSSDGDTLLGAMKELAVTAQNTL